MESRAAGRAWAEEGKGGAKATGWTGAWGCSKCGEGGDEAECRARVVTTCCSSYVGFILFVKIIYCVYNKYKMLLLYNKNNVIGALAPESYWSNLFLNS